MKNFTYSRDVRLGTWLILGFILLSAFGTFLYFEKLTAKYEPPTPKCDICRWTNPNP